MKPKDFQTGDLFKGMPKVEGRKPAPEDLASDRNMTDEEDDLALKMTAGNDARLIRPKTREERVREDQEALEARREGRKMLGIENPDDEEELF